jgi:septal ring factor EnvC (AmiA/AmiB activator)
VKRTRTTLAVLCAALLAVPAAAGERDLKQAELTKLRERIGSLRQALEETKGRFSTARKELRDTERRIGRLVRNIRGLDADIAGKRQRLDRLAAEQRALRASIDTQRAHLAAQVRASHAMGRQEYLKLVLNQEDPAALGRVLVYYDYMNQARAGRIGALREDVQRLDAVGVELNTEAKRLAVLRADRAAELKALEADRKQRSVLVAKLRREVDGKDQRLQHLLADERDLVRLLQGLADAVDDLPPAAGQSFAKSRGRLPWPTRGKVAAAFGTDRAYGRLRWQGLLIRANQGQEVKAVSHGRVAFAEWLRGYGLLVIIDHGEGYMSLYGHNQSVLAEVGDWVQAGQLIATVGDSGGSDHAGLYFEIRHNGKPLDPAKWVLARR